ncbi:MAG: type I-C CRISPR-associated protein Cas5c [Clostridiales bacterium]|jgi:CRISPR-associated protein Cas5d|nr:type I-C CRISPR-associated protein Cas5c [Clostridiales bacterium]
MARGVVLRVWGDYALFSRPEMKVERVSYDVMTPTAAKGVLSSIMWKPAIFWVIDKIHVMKEIQFVNFWRNEVSGKISGIKAKSAAKSGDGGELEIIAVNDRSQRAARLLKDVEYVIEAHFEMSRYAGPRDNEAKFADILRRRLEDGACHSRPFLGTREFSASFERVTGEIPLSPLTGEVDLGYMLCNLEFAPPKVVTHGSLTENIELEYTDDANPEFCRFKMVNGVIDVAECMKEVSK